MGEARDRVSADLRVRVTPRASRNEIAGAREGALLVRVTAAPEGGKANLAVCRLVARALRVAPSRVTVHRGAGARLKVLRIEDVKPVELEALLARHAREP